jgi:hypothetical protein
MPLIRRFIGRVRRCAGRQPLLFCPDGWVPDICAIREPLRDPVHTGTGGRPPRRPWPHVLSAQGIKRCERRRVVATARRGPLGPCADDELVDHIRRSWRPRLSPAKATVSCTMEASAYCAMIREPLHDEYEPHYKGPMCLPPYHLTRPWSDTIGPAPTSIRFWFRSL